MYLIKIWYCIKGTKFFQRYLVPKIFECSGIELPEHNLIILCIYNSHKIFGARFLSILDSILHDAMNLYKKKKIM